MKKKLETIAPLHRSKCTPTFEGLKIFFDIRLSCVGVSASSLETNICLYENSKCDWQNDDKVAQAIFRIFFNSGLIIYMLPSFYATQTPPSHAHLLTTLSCPKKYRVRSAYRNVVTCRV